MSRPLPERPSLEWLRKAAKDHLRELRAHRPDARLAEAQLAVAREHGHPSWRALVAWIESPAARPAPPEADVSAFLRLVAEGPIADVRARLDAEPGLVNAAGPHPYWGGRPVALHVAVEQRRRDVFALLLERGADVDGRNEAYGHWSPLMVAAVRRHADLRDELLRRGARIGLGEALLLADDARVDALLAGHALPTVVPSGGSFLAFARTVHAVERLLACGARADVRDSFGRLPIELLADLGDVGRPLVARLEASGAETSAADRARLGDLPGIERLAQVDPTVARDPRVLLAAVGGGHHALVRWLLAQGAPPDARATDRSRQTALHDAAWNGDLAMVRLLVEAGADRAARDAEHDNTARGWAEVAERITGNPRCGEVVAYLDGAGASGPT